MVDKKLDDVKIVKGSGDVFADLGIPLDAKDRLKLQMARRISVAMEKEQLTQKEVAAKLNTDQAKVSNIVRGRLDGFTVDRLVGYLIDLGIDIDVGLSDAHVTRRGKLTVKTPTAAAA